MDPSLLKSCGLRPLEFLYGSMEYYKNHVLICEDSHISYHEGIDSYVEISEPRRSLKAMNELLKLQEKSLGINYRGLIHEGYYPFWNQRGKEYLGEQLGDNS